MVQASIIKILCIKFSLLEATPRPIQGAPRRRFHRSSRHLRLNKQRFEWPALDAVIETRPVGPNFTGQMVSFGPRRAGGTKLSHRSANIRSTRDYWWLSEPKPGHETRYFASCDQWEPQTSEEFLTLELGGVRVTQNPRSPPCTYCSRSKTRAS